MRLTEFNYAKTCKVADVYKTIPFLFLFHGPMVWHNEVEDFIAAQAWVVYIYFIDIKHLKEQFNSSVITTRNIFCISYVLTTLLMIMIKQDISDDFWGSCLFKTVCVHFTNVHVKKPNKG